MMEQTTAAIESSPSERVSLMDKSYPTLRALRPSDMPALNVEGKPSFVWMDKAFDQAVEAMSFIRSMLAVLIFRLNAQMNMVESLFSLIGKRRTQGIGQKNTQAPNRTTVQVRLDVGCWQ